ncbi:MAG: hypothetical protein V3W11_02340 [bacterium]
MTRRLIVWTAVVAAAALAPSAVGMGTCFGGGLAAYSGVEITTPEYYTRSDMGSSWALGGGLAIPVWWSGGAVSLTLELATYVNFSMIDKELIGPQLDDVNLKLTAIPIREAVIFGVGVGPRAMIKPYVGFGGGVTIVAWKVYDARPGYPELEIDSATNVKPTFGIPFGCDFRLTPNFSLGPRGEYLIITGKVDGYNRSEDELFDSTVPNIFFFGAQARFDF